MRLVVTEKHPTLGQAEQVIYQGDDWDHATFALTEELARTACWDYAESVMSWWKQVGKPLSQAGSNPSFTMRNGRGTDTWQAWPDDVKSVGQFEVR